jgi:hypothetical protein
VGANVRERFDAARTPYRRLLAAGALAPAPAEALARVYAGLDPIALRAQLDAALAALWSLAERPDAAARTPKRS